MKLQARILIAILVCVAILSACSTKSTPQTIKETQIVVETQVVKETSVVKETQVVKETVVQKEEVQVEVTKEVVVEVTAAPEMIDFWNPADVTAATGADKCTPLAALPKTFSKATKIGFVGANNAHPFHGLAQQGMEDASKFYGVEFVNVDAAGNPELDLALTLLTQGVQAMGVLGQGMDVVDPVGAAAQEQNVYFIPADSGKTEYSPYTYGVADALSGKAGGELLAEGVKKAQEGAWKDKELFFLETTYTSIPACVARTGGAAKAFQEALGLDADHMLKIDGVAGAPIDQVQAALTAHPDAVFGLIPCWDQLGVDPWNAAREAGRSADVMLVTLGGDKPYADLLVTKPENYYGYVEFQPYCEGWGWTETALAIIEGERFVPYVPRTVTTQATIDARYQELYGALP